MAIHNFNYTYTLDTVNTIPLSMSNNTLIVKNVCVEVIAVDKADKTQTITEKMYASLSGVYSYKIDGLPENFILISDLTDNKAIEWYQATTTIEDLDAYFTWQLYGWEEVDPMRLEE